MALVFFCLALVAGVAFGQVDFQISYVAKQMNQYCDLRAGGSPSQPTQAVATPRVGKAGPRGPEGVPGPAAEVDYSRVDRHIDAKLKEMQDKIAAMERLHEQQLTEMRNKLEFHDHFIRGQCKVEYHGRCFWAVKTPVTRARAMELCKSKGGNLANIYDARHFELLREYLATLFSNGKGVYTGISYSHQTSTVTFANGTQSSFTKWRSGHPTGNTARTSVIIDVRSDPNNATFGMWDAAPARPLDGHLCEI